jgi:hypothetical protein
MPMISLSRLRYGFAGRLLRPCETASAVRRVRDSLQVPRHGKEQIVENLWALLLTVDWGAASVFFAAALAVSPLFLLRPFSVRDTV